MIFKKNKSGSGFEFFCQIRIRKETDPYHDLSLYEHSAAFRIHILKPDPAKNLNPDPEDPSIRSRIQAVS